MVYYYKRNFYDFIIFFSILFDLILCPILFKLLIQFLSLLRRGDPIYHIRASSSEIGIQLLQVYLLLLFSVLNFRGRVFPLSAEIAVQLFIHTLFIRFLRRSSLLVLLAHSGISTKSTTPTRSPELSSSLRESSGPISSLSSELSCSSYLVSSESLSHSN
jgi:hypothetical protein